MADEIDLNEEEEAALDRAWARIAAQEQTKRGGKDEAEDDAADEADEDEE